MSKFENNIQIISSLTHFKFDEKKLKNRIRKYTKLPRMLTVEGICRINGVKFEDLDSHMVFTQDKHVITIPKDGYSDAYRIQDMVESQTLGGSGVIYLPCISGVMEGKTVEEKWDFKAAWDERVAVDTDHLWGGSFLTMVDDYVDDDTGDFAELDLAYPYYYNIAMHRRDKHAFALVNPGFTFKECKEDCLGKPTMHYHAVSGNYDGAYVDGVPCAPPAMCLTGEAEYFPTLNPTNNDYVECATALCKLELSKIGGAPSMAAKATTKTAVKPKFNKAVEPKDAPRGRVSITEGRPVAGRFFAGMRAPEGRKWLGMKLFVEAASSEMTSLEDLRNAFAAPNGPPYPDIECKSTSGKQKIRSTWSVIYKKQVVPKLEEGIALNALLQDMWDLDRSASKHVTAYLCKRLLADQNIVQTEDGYVYLQGYDEVDECSESFGDVLDQFSNFTFKSRE